MVLLTMASNIRKYVLLGLLGLGGLLLMRRTSAQPTTNTFNVDIIRTDELSCESGNRFFEYEFIVTGIPAEPSQTLRTWVRVFNSAGDLISSQGRAEGTMGLDGTFTHTDTSFIIPSGQGTPCTITVTAELLGTGEYGESTRTFTFTPC